MPISGADGATAGVDGELPRLLRLAPVGLTEHRVGARDRQARPVTESRAPLWSRSNHRSCGLPHRDDRVRDVGDRAGGQSRRAGNGRTSRAAPSRRCPAAAAPSGIRREIGYRLPPHVGDERCPDSDGGDVTECTAGGSGDELTATSAENPESCPRICRGSLRVHTGGKSGAGGPMMTHDADPVGPASVRNRGPMAWSAGSAADTLVATERRNDYEDGSHERIA